MAIFSIQDALIKFVYEDCALYELYFGRTLTAAILLISYLKFSKQKIIYLYDLSINWEQIETQFSNIEKMRNREISNILLDVKGIGQWTIDMFLIFSLARPDVFPSGDLAIQKGFAFIKNMDTLPTIKYMIDESEIWKPYRTVASLYLWKINDGEFEW